MRFLKNPSLTSTQLHSFVLTSLGPSRLAPTCTPAVYQSSMPPNTAQTVAPLALPVLLVLLVSARSAEPEEQQREEAVDPEVTTCRQQCAGQQQFGAAERRFCLRQCDEYGRAKRREEEEGPDRERDRCLHECRAGPPKPGCERRCQEAYDRATTRGRGGAGPRDLAAVPARRVSMV